MSSIRPHVCLRNRDVKTGAYGRILHQRLSRVTLMSLWALESSPLMLGMNLPDNDEWTDCDSNKSRSSGTIDQDALGRAARRMFGAPVPAETWFKELADGTYAVGFFNRTDQSVRIDVPKAASVSTDAARGNA